jgi:hypothetical protein
MIVVDQKRAIYSFITVFRQYEAGGMAVFSPWCQRAVKTSQ